MVESTGFVRGWYVIWDLDYVEGFLAFVWRGA